MTRIKNYVKYNSGIESSYPKEKKSEGNYKFL